MKTLFNWLKAIGIVLVFIVALYAVWILAILLAIGTLIYLVQTVIKLDHMDDTDEEIQD